MRGAWGALVGLSIAIVIAPIGLSAQQSKSLPPRKNSQAAAKERVEPGDLNRDTTFRVLTEAYNSSRDLPSEQRIPLLSEICDISATINYNSSPLAESLRGRVHASPSKPTADLTRKQRDKLRDWAEELFQHGREFPSDSRIRSQAEIAAARSMVAIDAKRAMELMDSFDAGPAMKGRESPWSVVSALFIRLYDTQGAAAFPDIRREALSLGDREAYPYIPVLNLLQKVHDRPDVTRQFFADALDYFRRGGTDRPQVYGLMTLLSSDPIRNQLQPWQVQDATAQIVASVKDYVRSQTEHPMDSESANPNIRPLLQFVKSSLEHFAPDAAAQLPDPAAFSFTEDNHLLSVNARRKTPQAPAPDDSMKALQKEFEKSRTAMIKLGEDEVHEGPEMQQTIGRTMALGAEWVERTIQGYAPEDHAYAMLVSTSELAGVARLGAHINPATTLAAIRQIQDDELKTKLLLAVARTIEYLR